MKKLFIIFVMLLPLFVLSQESNSVYPEDKTKGLWNSNIFDDNQNLFIEWRLYLKDCNQLVSDTVEQSGKVKCELVPVKMNGKIVSYNTVPVDTVWFECECKEYKSFDWNHANLSMITSGSSLSTGYVNSSGFHTWYEEPEPARNTFLIERNKVCQIKKRKASFEDFIERWCVEKKLIEFN